jgi:hypothetical protein
LRARLNGGGPSAPYGLRLALAAALLSGGCATAESGSPLPAAPTLRSGPDDSELLGVIAAGPETVLEVDMAQIRSSPWSRSLVSAMAADERAAKIAAQGFDEVADVDRVIFAVTEGEGGPTTLMVARGRFDEARVGRAFGEAGRSSWRGSPLWKRGDRAIALLTGRTLISGTPAAVRAAIDCAWGVVPDVRGAALVQLRRALETERGQPGVTATVTVGEAMRARIGAELPVPPGLKQVGVRLDLGGPMDLELVELLGNEREAAAAAHNLEITVRELRSRRALRVFGLAPIFDSATVRAEGTRVRGHLHLPEERRDDLAAKIAFVIETIVRARAK